MVQWLVFGAFTARAQGSILSWGTKIIQALWWSQEKKRGGMRVCGALKLTKHCAKDFVQGAESMYSPLGTFLVLLVLSCSAG